MQVCDYIEKHPTVINGMLAGVTRFKAPIQDKYGVEMGEKLFQSLMQWFEVIENVCMHEVRTYVH
jgi:hypothetical protein